MAKNTKAQTQLASARHRASLARLGAAADIRVERAKNNLRRERTARKGEALMAGLGMHATGVVAGQVHREVALKKDKPGMARAVNYGGGILGLWLATNARTANGRTLGGALIGMSVGQLTLDTVTKDLVPGMNG